MDSFPEQTTRTICEILVRSVWTFHNAFWVGDISTVWNIFQFGQYESWPFDAAPLHPAIFWTLRTCSGSKWKVVAANVGGALKNGAKQHFRCPSCRGTGSDVPPDSEEPILYPLITIPPPDSESTGGKAISADTGKKPPPFSTKSLLTWRGFLTGFDRFGGKSVLTSKWSKIEVPAAHFLPLRAPQAKNFDI